MSEWLLGRFPDARDICRLSEGLSSQAFTFRRADEGFILRINPCIAGFRKDAHAVRAFTRQDLPIPAVTELGEFDADLAFCVSRRAPGTRLDRMDATAARRLAPGVAAAIAAIASTDIRASTGFGRFGPTGGAPHPTWRAFLLAIADRDWAPVRSRVDPALLDSLQAVVRALSPACQEVRHLVHGDFFGSNLLSDGQAVTAVIDWDLALFGDPLYEWANLAFWNEACLRPALALAPRPVPGYGERMRCHMARIGLEELHASATGRFPDSLAWQRMAEHGVTFTMGATPYLADTVREAPRREAALPALRYFIAAGAPIPRAIVEEAGRRMPSLHVLAGWGMTENGLVTINGPTDPVAKVYTTDGSPQPGMEVRVADETGQTLPPGREGYLKVRGSQNFVGYVGDEDGYRASFDADGSFQTWDLAVRDTEGYLRITGRAKDVINRGGEKVPVAEVEELIYRHPKVREAALVAMPHARLGETGCLFAVPHEGQALSFEEIIAHLRGAGLTPQFLPERLELVAALPRTPSGKIQKYLLREEIARRATMWGRGLRSGGAAEGRALPAPPCPRARAPPPASGCGRRRRRGSR